MASYTVCLYCLLFSAENRQLKIRLQKASLFSSNERWRQIMQINLVTRFAWLENDGTSTQSVCPTIIPCVGGKI